MKSLCCIENKVKGREIKGVVPRISTYRERTELLMPATTFYAPMEFSGGALGNVNPAKHGTYWLEDTLRNWELA